jgi:hypothetical protein
MHPSVGTARNTPKISPNKYFDVQLALPFFAIVALRYKGIVIIEPAESRLSPIRY